MAAAYKQIAGEVKRTHGFTVQTCWIARVKSDLGLSARRAWNRQSDGRTKECPPDKRDPIIAAIKRLG